jgi:hypothetical protein
MKKQISIALIFIFLFAFLLPISDVEAQTYSFSVDREQIDLFWENDGTLSILYEITFSNASFADPLDFVDIGLPNNNFSIANISASIDGQPINNIEDSPYVAYGVALGLGANSIQPGQSGTVQMQVSGISNVLYTDNEDSAYASAVFSPNYFGSEFVQGSTDITLVYHLPPGVQPAEPKWHPAPSGFPEEPVTGFDNQDRITYTWQNPSASASEFLLFGASFPLTYIPAGTISEPSISQQTGINFDSDAVIAIIIFSCICLGFIVFIWAIVAAERRRKLRYLPPKIAIEGNGIKRGLTAPEAAILLEQPMDKIMTMILFSAIKKNAASVEKRDPLRLDIPDPLPLHLHEYETLFIDAFRETHKTKRRKALQKMMVKLVKSVANKMKGFSKRETVTYYRKIIEEAWAQVENADTPAVKSEKFEEELEWTMLDKDYDRRAQDTFSGPIIVPTWWNRYDPGFGRSTPISTAGKSSSVPSVSTGGRAPSLPTLPGGDFAASMVAGVQNMSAGVLGSLGDFTGGVTKVTNPPPKSISSSRGRSGGGWSGGGSSCACACAGCACACAGGGR